MFFNKWIPITFIAVLMTVMIAGCGGGGSSSPGRDEAPVIKTTSATNAKNCAGGTVTIAADVTDASGVKSVTAVVTNPSGVASPVLSLGHVSGDTYSGSYTAAENSESYAVTYSVVVTATDTADNSTPSNAFTFKVPGETPPSPPSWNSTN